MSPRDDLHAALHHLVDAAIVAADALYERGAGDRLDDAIAALDRAAARVRAVYAAVTARSAP